MPALAGRRFDRILFLQLFGYAKDPVHALKASRAMLTDDGFVLLTRTQPIRYAIERAEENGPRSARSTLDEFVLLSPSQLERGRHADQAALHDVGPAQHLQRSRNVG